jgi:hypothetical protein
MRMCSPGGWAPGPDSTTKPPVGAGRRLLLPAAQRVQVGPGWLQALLAAVLLCCSMLQGHAQGGRVVMQPWGLSAPQGAHAPARTPAYDFFTGRLPTPVLLQVLPVMLQTQKHTHQHHTQAVCELLLSLRCWPAPTAVTWLGHPAMPQPSTSAQLATLLHTPILVAAGSKERAQGPWLCAGQHSSSRNKQQAPATHMAFLVHLAPAATRLPSKPQGPFAEGKTCHNCSQAGQPLPAAFCQGPDASLFPSLALCSGFLHSSQQPCDLKCLDTEPQARA